MNDLIARLAGLNRWKPLLQKVLEGLGSACLGVAVLEKNICIGLSEEVECEKEILVQVRDGGGFTFIFYLNENLISDGDWSTLKSVLHVCVENILLTEKLTAVSHRAWSKLSEGSELIPVSLSKLMKECLDKARLVAPHVTPVLLMGETGSGKEVLANFVHRLSSRRNKPFLAVNCAAIPASLLESTLFGHVKGAFTGALLEKEGYFQRASDGTLFLDEIGELTLEAQAGLLRVLETGVYEKVGGGKAMHADVRVIAASHKNLAAMVRKGDFRDDLYYRISTFPIAIPPLRERKEDVVPLAEVLLAELTKKLKVRNCGYSSSFYKQLLAYDWPGNVRELKNELEKALILSAGKKLKLNIEATRHEEAISSFDDAVKEIIERALNSAGGKVQGMGGAADILKLNSQTLYSKIRKLGIEL